MRMEDASKKLKFHNDLLGRSLSGASIDELIIAPTDMDLRQQFEKLYVSSLDAQMAIKPFIAEDVDVLVVFDKKRIHEQGVLISTSLDKTLKMLSNENYI